MVEGIFPLVRFVCHTKGIWWPISVKLTFITLYKIYLVWNDEVSGFVDKTIKGTWNQAQII